MVMWSAVAVLVASLLVLGPLAESAPSWAAEAAMTTLALSAFVLVCLLEAGGRADKSTD